MENLQKQETVAKIMELIDGGQDFYQLAVELAFSQKVNQEVYNLLVCYEYSYKIKMMFINKQLFIHALKTVLNEKLSTADAQNTRIDGRSILVKTPACQICSPF